MLPPIIFTLITPDGIILRCHAMPDTPRARYFTLMLHDAATRVYDDRHITATLRRLLRDAAYLRAPWRSMLMRYASADATPPLRRHAIERA